MTPNANMGPVCSHCMREVRLPDTLPDPAFLRCIPCGLRVPPALGARFYTACPDCRLMYCSKFAGCPACRYDAPSVPHRSAPPPPALILRGDGGSEALTLAAAVVGTGPQLIFELISNAQRLSEVASLLTREPLLVLDTETTGLDPYEDRLLLVQIGSRDDLYIIDCRAVPDLSPLAVVLTNPQQRKILQNAKFDYGMLLIQAGIRTEGVIDTMLAERLLTAGSGTRVSLAQLALKYAGVVLDKGIRKNFIARKVGHVWTPEELQYAARDIQVLWTIWDAQHKLLAGLGMERVAELEFQCAPAVADMELAGLRLDTVQWREILRLTVIERKRLKRDLYQMLGQMVPQTTMFDDVSPVNLNSNSQLLQIFRGAGLNMQNTTAATLQEYSDNPLVGALLGYREQEKVCTSFGESLLSLIHPITGRIHPTFQQYGADTGRFSCSGPNMQQLTKAFRHCVIPDLGYMLVICDYSQAELRILAELSGDTAFLEAFHSGGDLHKLTASRMFGIPLDAVTKAHRDAAKAINFGLAYGMGPSALARRMGVGKEEGVLMVANYFAAYQGVGQWLEHAGQSALTLGYSETLMGRRRFYTLPERSDPEYRKKRGDIERQGKNTPIQGCVDGDTIVIQLGVGPVPLGSLTNSWVVLWDGRHYAGGWVLPSGLKQVCLLTMSDGRCIRCSPDHRFLLSGPDECFKACGELLPGDLLLTLFDHYSVLADTAVQSMLVTSERIPMFDFVNSTTGRFMVNGVVSHNSNADMTKLALIRLRAVLPAFGARTVNTVHDEIVVEVPIARGEEVKELVKLVMQEAGQTLISKCPVVADAVLADHWEK